MRNVTFSFFIASLLSVAMLAACSQIPGEAYSNRGAPESLMDVSSEIVTVELLSQDSVAEVTEWVESDQPTRAEIYCAEGDVLCDATEDAFVLFGVEYEWIPSSTSEVNLVYERIIAHDCEHRFIDNRINPYNFNHPSFGCSTASNMLQMVSDRRQFVSPALLGFYDGESASKGVQAYRSFDSREFFGDDIGVDSLEFQGSN